MLKQQLRPALKRALGPESPSDARPVVVLGVGSEMRSDDAAGLHVAAAVSRARLPGVHAWETGPAPENFTAEIRRQLDVGVARPHINLEILQALKAR